MLARTPKQWPIVLALLTFFPAFARESSGQDDLTSLLTPLAESIPNDTQPLAEETSEQEKMMSLAEDVPYVVQHVMHYPKFFGDPLTINGGFFERSYVTDDWGGLRTQLIDNYGIYPFIQMTQFMEGNVAGGTARKLRANGSLDFGLWFDTGKANLWPGGGIFLHGETAWAPSKNPDVGSTVPSNIDATRPRPGTPGIGFSQYYFVQVLNKKFKLAIGKMDLGAWADTNLWANNWKTQFSSTALVNNPQLAAIIPYTTYAGWLTYTASDDLLIVYTINTEDSTATQAGFDTIFNGHMVNSLQFIYTPKNRRGLPTQLNVIVGYGSGEQPDFAVNERNPLKEIQKLVPDHITNGNYGIIISKSSYLATWDSGYAEDSPLRPSRPLGFGWFWRYGGVPEDRNVISQFFSVGLGGWGGPGRRIYDNWGIGWGGSYISPKLRASLTGISELNVWENTSEMFYNARVTPNTKLTVNFQITDSALSVLDTSYAIGTRLQIDF